MADLFYDRHDNAIDMVKTFRGDCFGIGLARRAIGDNHVSVYVLVEDDENWMISHNGGFSSHWLPDLAEQIEAARAWMKRNCRRDRDGFGYSFKQASCCPARSK